MKWNLLQKNSYLIFSALIILTAIFVRLRFLNTPLERDEGEYAYIGQILLKGLLPYRDAVNLKFPGIFFIYSSIFLILPETPAGIHIALLVTNLTTALFLFLIARRLFNNFVASVTVTSFMVVTLSPSIHGLGANSEHFVMLFVLAAFLLILTTSKTGKTYFFAGLLLGLATLTKQHALLFFIFGAGYIAYITAKSHSKKQILLIEVYFFAGALVPVLSTALWLSSTNNIDEFLFWTIKYALAYATETRIDPETYQIFFRFFLSAPASIFLASVGAVGILFRKTRNPAVVFALLFFVASLLAMSPGLLFRPHYYILLIPSLSLLLGAGVDSLFNLEVLKKREPLTYFIILLAVTSPLLLNRYTFFNLSPDELSRQTYGANPFPESLTLASYLKNSSRPEDKIAILGSEPQIYFYADRVSATKYILTYPLMESHSFAARMQREFIGDLEESQPQYIIFVSVATSWLRQEDSHDTLFNWFPGYINERYTLDSLVDIIPNGESRFIHGSRVAQYRPHSGNVIQVYKKKDRAR